MVTGNDYIKNIKNLNLISINMGIVFITGFINSNIIWILLKLFF